MSGEFPTIKSAHSLVAKHVTKERWDKVKDIKTKTCGFTMAQACACAIEFDNQVFFILTVLYRFLTFLALRNLCW